MDLNRIQPAELDVLLNMADLQSAMLLQTSQNLLEN